MRVRRIAPQRLTLRESVSVSLAAIGSRDSHRGEKQAALHLDGIQGLVRPYKPHTRNIRYGRYDQSA